MEVTIINKASAWTRAIVAVVTFAGVIALASPAFAHARLVSSSPADHSNAGAVSEVTLTFNEPADPIFIKLVGQSGAEVAGLPKPTADGATIHLTLPETLEKGRYVVKYRVLTDDTHPVSGSISFSIGPDQ